MATVMLMVVIWWWCVAVLSFVLANALSRNKQQNNSALHSIDFAKHTQQTNINTNTMHKYLHLHINERRHSALFKQYGKHRRPYFTKRYSIISSSDLWLSIWHSTPPQPNEIDTRARWNALIDFYYLWLEHSPTHLILKWNRLLFKS